MDTGARSAVARCFAVSLAFAMAVACGCATAAFPPEEPLPAEDGGAVSDAGAPDEDGGAEEDGGASLEDGGAEPDAGEPSDAGLTMDAGRVDAGVDAGLAPDAGPRDAGEPPDAGVMFDAGTVDAGPPSCVLDAGVLGTRCGATKIFESTEGTGPSAFDFRAGRALFLSSEVSPVLGDVYLLSAELAPSSPGTNTQLALVSPRDSAVSGGERGVFRQTGIEDLTALGGGIDNPDTFTAIPAALVLRPGTRSATHRVLAVAGHIYALELAQGSDGGTTYAALYIDRVVTPAGDGGALKQTIEARWLHQSQPGRRTFDRPFPQ